MAEALGVVASIVGLAGAGSKLALVVFDFAASVGAAGRELQLFATEIAGFCAVLLQLRPLLQHAHFAPSTEAVEAAQRIVRLCGLVFVEVEGVLEELRKARGAEVFPDVDFVGRVRWTFSRRPRVLLLRRTLDACKSTLSVMLGTMLLAERVARRRRSGGSSAEEILAAAEEHERAVTQSLVIAQQCAVEQLEVCEDEVEREQDAALLLPALEHAAARPTGTKARRRSMGRLVRMFSGPSVMTDLPTPPAAPPRPPTRAERTSIWLDSFLAPPDRPQGPHPGKQTQKLMSSVGTEDAPLQLLRKWTDQGGDNMDNKSKPQSASPVQNPDEEPEIWRQTRFAFPNSNEPVVNGDSHMSPEASPTPGIEKTPTDLISPKTARVQSLGYRLVVGVHGMLEPSNEVLTTSTAADDSYEAIASSIMIEHGASSFDIRNIVLCVAYGGKMRALKPSDKPLEVLKHYEELELDPHLFIRRVQGSAG